MDEKKKKEMNQHPSLANQRCRQCGDCCHMEIPLSVLDIQRMAVFHRSSLEKMFRTVVQPQISETSSLFKIRKQPNGACIFLSDANTCTIHPAKPRACHFYNCALPAGNDAMPWTATCTDPSQRARLWEQSVAAIYTKRYIDNNGAAWHANDFTLALKGILANIAVRDSQKLKLARNAEGAPVALIYDCTKCEKQGLCANETPVTLNDIRRIAASLKVSWQTFFETYIAEASSAQTGGLKLKRTDHCIFFNPAKGCRVETVRPLHCRFTPCPSRTQSAEMMDAFYLGSGTVMEQFHHQVALAVSREYVSAFGSRYDEAMMTRCLRDFDNMVSVDDELKCFCEKIARFRYVDDTLSVFG